MSYFKDKLFPIDAPAKADPFTLESLIAWLETKPADEEYCWIAAGDCLFHQYGKYIGIDAPYGRPYLPTVAGFRHLSPPGDNPYVEPRGIASGFPCTFGGALRRARAALINGGVS